MHDSELALSSSVFRRWARMSRGLSFADIFSVVATHESGQDMGELAVNTSLHIRLTMLTELKQNVPQWSLSSQHRYKGQRDPPPRLIFPLNHRPTFMLVLSHLARYSSS